MTISRAKYIECSEVILSKNLSKPVFEWVFDGKVSLCSDAHHQEGLEGHQDVLERVPQVGEEHDEHLVVKVQVKSLKD